MAIEKNKSKKDKQSANDLKAGASTSMTEGELGKPPANGAAGNLSEPIDKMPNLPANGAAGRPGDSFEKTSEPPANGSIGKSETAIDLHNPAGKSIDIAAATYEVSRKASVPNGGAQHVPASRSFKDPIDPPDSYSRNRGDLEPIPAYRNFKDPPLGSYERHSPDPYRNDKMQMKHSHSNPATIIPNGSAAGEMRAFSSGRIESKTTFAMTETTSSKFSARGSSQIMGGQVKAYDHAEKIRSIFKRCRNELGPNADRILKGCPNLESFRNFVNAQRIRDMPDEGSLSDNSMRWVGQFGAGLLTFAQQLSSFFPGSNHKQTAESLLGCCKALLLIGSRHVDALQRFYDELYKIATTLESFESHRDVYVSSPELQRTLLALYWNIAELVIRITLLYHNRPITRALVTEAEELITAIMKGFIANKEILEQEIWLNRLRESPIVQGTGPVSVPDLKAWLRQGKVDSPKPTSCEGTCTWFDRTLSEFKGGEDQLLVLFGKSGSGKSMLYNWIIDRLRLHQQDILMSFAFDTSVTNGTSSVFMLKSLLLQLLDKSLGDVHLFKKLADIYMTASSKTAVDCELEPALWEVFANAAKATRELNMVIDGLDHVTGGREKAQEIVNRVREIINLNGANSLNCIFLSAPFATKLTGEFTPVDLDPENTRYDIHIYVTKVLEDFFGDSVSIKDRQKVISLVTSKTDGSFVVANLLLQSVKRGKNIDDIVKILGNSTAAGEAGLLDALLASIDLKNRDTIRILSWMLVSEEPLSVHNMKELLEISYTGQTASRSPRLKWDVEKDIIEPCGSLVVVDRNFLQFSHPSIKQHFWKHAEKNKDLPSAKQCHAEVTLSMLAYIKTANIPRELEGGFQAQTREAITGILDEHSLLSYCVRRWITHFKKSTIYGGGEISRINPPTELVPVFPSSPNFPQIEYTLWALDKTAEGDFVLASSIRQALLTDEPVTIIHSFMNLSRIRFVSGNFSGALEVCYKAFKLCQTLFGNISHEGWEIASIFSSMSKNRESDYSGEVFDWMITYCKITKTEMNEVIIDIVKRYGDSLSKKNKDQEAMKHYRWLWDECSHKYGEVDERTSFILDQMVEILQKNPNATDFLDLCRKQLTVAEATLKPWDKQHVKAAVKLARAYETSGRATEVTSVFDKSIKTLTTVLYQSSGEEVLTIHEARVHLIAEYAQYYVRVGSRDSAVLLLRQFWEQYRPDVRPLRSHSTGLIIQLIALAELLVSCDLTDDAEELYSSMWSYFRQSPELSTSEFAYKAGLGLARLRKGAHADPKEEESILKGLVDVLNPAGLDQPTEVGLDAYCSLGRFYEEQKNWQKLQETSRGALERFWPECLQEKHTESLTLPRHFEEKCVQLVYLYGDSYQEDTERACWVYKLVHTACQNTLMPNTHPRVIQAFKDYCGFCEKKGKSKEALTACQASFESLTRNPGLSHESTLEIGLSLAKMYQKEEQTEYAIRIYHRISESLLQTELTSSSFEILADLFHVYQETAGQETEAIKFSISFWEKISKTSEFYFFPDVDLVFKIYEKVRYNLEKTRRPSSEIIATVQCLMNIYANSVGEHNLYYFKASLAYAQLLEADAKRAKEAIEEYEKLLEMALRMSGSEDHTSIILQIQQSLARLYLLDQSTAGKAEELYRNLFEEFRATHSLTHSLTIRSLEQLIQFYSNKKDCDSASVLLQDTVIDVLATESREKYLFDSALAIAKMFFQANINGVGQRLIRDLRRYCRMSQEERRAFNAKDARFKKLVIKNNQSLMMDRKFQVFFTTFETVIRNGGKVGNDEDIHSSVISVVLQESEHYMAWLGATKFGDGLDVILAAGARLRAFLRAQGRADEFKWVEDDLRTIFLREFKTFGPENKQKTGIELKFSPEMLEEFFQECLALFANSDQNEPISLVNVGLKRVEATIEHGDIDAAFIIAVWTHKVISEENKLGNVFRLLFHMTSDKVKATPNPILKADIAKFTQLILQEILSGDMGIAWVSVDLSDLHRLTLLLGAEKRYDFMQAILEQLWDSRNSHDDIWSPGLVTTIGCRLVDVYMEQGKKEAALRVLERIYYNYSRVFGPTQPETQRFGKLLCQIYNSAGLYGKCMAISERTLHCLRDEGHSATLTRDEASDLIFTQLELYKYAQSRKPSKANDPENLGPMIKELEGLFYSKNSKWSEVSDFRAWAQKPVGQEETAFTWHSPNSWGIMDDDDDDDDDVPPQTPGPPPPPSRKQKYRSFARSSFASLFQN